MEVENYKKAKIIREKINHLNIKKLQIEQMKKREDDEEFTLARQLAHDNLCYTISRLEEDFSSI